MLAALPGAPRVVNAKLVRTADYSIELQKSGPARLPALYHPMHLVGVILSGEPVIVRGQAGWHRIDRLSASDCYLRPAGRASEVTWPLGIHALYLHLHPRLLRRLTGATCMRWTLDRRPVLRDPVVTELLLVLAGLHRAGGLTPGTAQDPVLALGHHLLARYRVPAPEPARIGALTIEAVCDILRDQPHLDLETLAVRAGMSRSHFSRSLGQVLGASARAFRLGSRIEAAKFHLSRRGLPLAQVAHLAGFYDQSHLTRLFRHSTGLTPARFRALQRSSS
jgi:AraC-like DNA-binding protein